MSQTETQEKSVTTGTEITEAKARPPAVQSGGTISAMIPTDIDQAFRLARAIAMSGMAPKAYGNDENKCFVGILAGAELGLAPFQALQSIAVIGNNPSIWGDGALALVESSGELEDIIETDDGHTATCRIKRRGKSEIVRTFSMDDAKKAGLANKQGPWTQYPRRMRQMRARSWALRDRFSDVLKGLHIAEEVRDRPDVYEGPRTSPLSSQMLAEQAGVTVEQSAPEEEIKADPREQQAETTEVDEETARQLDAGDDAEPEAEEIEETDDLAELRSRLAQATSQADVASVDADFQNIRVRFSDEDADEMQKHIDGRMKALREPKGGK